MVKDLFEVINIAFMVGIVYKFYQDTLSLHT